jgi:hypothetical protein
VYLFKNLKAGFMIRILYVLCFIVMGYNTNAQSVKILTSGTKTGMRGLSVVNDKVIWVSGSNGTVGRSLDSGKTWRWMTVKGFEKMDFRDIEAFDETSAVIMGIDAPAYILRTSNGGESWDIVYQNNEKGMFLDAMEFWNEESGIVIGDPLNKRFFVARTFDGGLTWEVLPEPNKPLAKDGEACFAASGTNIRKLDNKEAIFITGGTVSNVHVRETQIKLPLMQGTETTGANSIAVKNKKTWMVVGGDFNKKDSARGNAAITFNAGKSWSIPTVFPGGYRSCVEYLQKKQWITCGLNGVDISNNDGKTFSNISREGFHVVRKAKTGKAVFFAGSGGRIGKLIY